MWVRIGAKAAVTAVTALAVAGLAWAPAPQARAASTPARGSFHTYAGSTPLAQIKPGTVLSTRTLSYHIVGIALPVQVVQLLYRSAGALGQPTANVTSVLEPPVPPASPRAVSYQSFYDSTFPVWAPAALTWLNSRFAGSQAPNDCAQIPPGNSLAPVKPAS